MADNSFRKAPRSAAWVVIILVAFADGIVADEPHALRKKPRAIEAVEVRDEPRVKEEAPRDFKGKPREFEDQTREFRVSVDGKERGKCTMRIDRRDDGADRLRVDSQLRFNYVVYEYKYASTGTEIWKEGRLIELDNSSDYNGTRYAVKAEIGTKKLQVTVNGKPTHFAEPDAWVTSYWHLPRHLVHPGEVPREGVVPAGGPTPLAASKTQIVPLLDSDQGRALRGELRFVGDEPIVVAGDRKTAHHYRVTGDVKANLWYDASLRLVRQESVDQGHETTLELIRITDHSKASDRRRSPTDNKRRSN